MHLINSNHVIEVVGQSVIPITMALLVVLSTIGAANGSIFAAARYYSKNTKCCGSEWRFNRYFKPSS